jgi:hypothetical protein
MSAHATGASSKTLKLKSVFLNQYRGPQHGGHADDVASGVMRCETGIADRLRGRSQLLRGDLKSLGDDLELLREVLKLLGSVSNFLREVLNFLRDVLKSLRSVLELLREVLGLLRSVFDLLRDVLKFLRPVLNSLRTVFNPLRDVFEMLRMRSGAPAGTGWSGNGGCGGPDATLLQGRAACCRSQDPAGSHPHHSSPRRTRPVNETTKSDVMTQPTVI